MVKQILASGLFPHLKMHHFFRILACYAVLKCKMSIDLFGKNILYHNIQLLPSKYTTISSVLALLVVIIMQCKGCYVVQLLYHFNNLEALSRQHFVILLLLYTSTSSILYSDKNFCSYHTIHLYFSK